MRLDSVLGYINPEMQMPNTVLLGLDGRGMAHTVDPWLGRLLKAELVSLWRQESPPSNPVTGTQGASRTESRNAGDA